MLINDGLPAERSRPGQPPFGAASGAVSLSLLRGFEVRHGARIIELPLGGQRLLAFLALQRRPVHRSFVAGTLWMDHTEERAQAALRTAVWRVRRILAGIIVTPGGCLALSRELAVDVGEVDACARHAVRRSGSPPSSAVAALCDTGDLLPDWYDDWLTIERERFRQMRLVALDALCEELSAEGRYGEATEAGLAAIATEPLRESAHLVLIQAHLAVGNAGEALRDYRLFSRLLQEHLGLSPSPRLRALIAGLGARA